MGQKIHYHVSIDGPKDHHVKVCLSFEASPEQSEVDFFLPTWSPGSYLIREYARHIRKLQAQDPQGGPLFVEQISKETWRVRLDHPDFPASGPLIELHYEVYCFELTVRTSHVDESHAFLHGPSYLMGVVGAEGAPTIEFHFPQLWSKLSTSLQDISQERGHFIYQARDFDELLDCPVEIGCQETDGFMFQERPFELCFYGPQYPHENDLKEDIKKIVEVVSAPFQGPLPFEKYTFITHFGHHLYGGLEHHSSTALHFDGRKLGHRRDYINWLSLVAHEFFHLWNIKRIRPRELGPFDYRRENYTTMLWLAEGLTSFMDELFIYRAQLITAEEYAELLRANLNRLLEVPGRKFHSLEQSSFNAWIKLYRPDENTRNSTVSYYTKGGLVFMVLHLLLKEQGRDIFDLLAGLWSRYQADPAVGLTSEEVYQIVADLGGEAVRQEFETMISTTFEIDFEKYLKRAGLAVEWAPSGKPWMGLKPKFEGDRVLVGEVALDGPAQKYGLNAGDEILAINGLRFLRADWEEQEKLLQAGQSYEVTINRRGTLAHVMLIPDQKPPRIAKLKIADQKLVHNTFALPTSAAP